MSRGAKNEEMTLTRVWREYEQGKNYFHKLGIYEQTDENFRMYEGDQWHGLESGGERLPILNIISPIVKYKVAMVAQNGMSIHYSSMNFENAQAHRMYANVCQMLNRHASQTWEKLKLDKLSWDVILNACVAGTAYLYFYQDGEQMKLEQINNTSIHFADEQEPDIQKQPYILIAQRRFVEDVKKEAKANGVKDLDLIVPDSDTSQEAGDSAKTEVDESRKCMSILKLWKKDGTVHICRSVRNVIYQPDTEITGMKLYPICAMIWEQKKGSARSDGAVRWLIPNQLEINKAQARLSIAVKKSAYPTLAYKTDAVINPDSLDTIGATIEVDSPSVQDIDNAIKYIQPAQINTMAKSMTDDLISITRELAGASDAVTGQVNPENASGAAIIAVRDAAALPLNAPIANYRQFVEDIALVWYDMWAVYNPGGMQVVVDDVPVNIPPEAMQKMKVDVRVDVSATNPYSKYAQEQTLEHLLSAQMITFEEYVDALDDDAAAPKGKLSDIVKKRQQAAMQQMAMQQAMQQRAMALPASGETSQGSAGAQQAGEVQPNEALRQFNADRLGGQI